MNEMCAARLNHLTEGEVEEGGGKRADVPAVHPVDERHTDLRFDHTTFKLLVLQICAPL